MEISDPFGLLNYICPIQQTTSGIGHSVIIIIIIISAHKSDLSYPWSQTQASLSIPSLHPKKTQTKEEKERKKITDEKTSPDLIGGEGKK